MIRALIALLLLLAAGPVGAQPASEPILKTSLEEDTAIPGQPLIYRVTVLVPTWLPKAPVFPSFEVPNVIVRLPSRASQPVSERVDGDTWSGVSRAYRLYPMIPGTIRIPAGAIQVTYADPQTRQPIETELDTPAFEIHGALPPGGEDVQPFLAARSLVLERSVEGDPGALAAGDALVLTTTVKVAGVSPMFVPPVSPTPAIDGLAFYAKSPGIEETENRGILSGTRTETTTVIAENAGSYQIPEAALSWYDLDSQTIKTETLPEIDLTVTGPAADATADPEPVDWRSVIGWMAVVLVIAGALWFLFRRYGPSISAQIKQLENRIRNSEWYAYRQFQKALRKRDYSLALKTGIDWCDKINVDPKGEAWLRFYASVTELGAGLFDERRDKATPDASKKWPVVARNAKVLRHQIHAAERKKTASGLKPLNPVSNQAFSAQHH